MEELTLFGLPDYLLVQQLAAVLPENLNDPGPVVEIMPGMLRIEESRFRFLIAH